MTNQVTHAPQAAAPAAPLNTPARARLGKVALGAIAQGTGTRRVGCSMTMAGIAAEPSELVDDLEPSGLASRTQEAIHARVTVFR